MAQIDISVLVKARDEASKVIKGIGASFSDLGNIFDRNKTQIAAVSGAIIGALALVGKQAIKVASDFEQNRIAFETMTGSAEKAGKLLKEISDFAIKTPFELPGVVQAAKQLLAMGGSVTDVLPDLKALGDVASGVNAPLERMIINFGQVRLQGKLTGRELRDFAVLGVPLIEELAKNLGVAKEAIADMVSAGEIGFPEVRKAFETMTQEGGKFGNLMEKQSHTFAGVMSNIKDQVTRTLAEIAGISVKEGGVVREGSLFAVLKDQAEGVLKALDVLTPKIIAFFDAFTKNKVAVAAVGGAIVGLLLAPLAIAITFFGEAVLIVGVLIEVMAVLGAFFAILSGQIERGAEVFNTVWIPAIEKAKGDISSFVDSAKQKFDEYETAFVEKFITPSSEGLQIVRDSLGLTSEQWADALGQTLADLDFWIQETINKFVYWKSSTEAMLQEWREQSIVGMQYWAATTKTSIINWTFDTGSAFLKWKENIWRLVAELQELISSFVNNRMNEWRIAIPMIWKEISEKWSGSLYNIIYAYKDLISWIERALDSIGRFFDRVREARELGGGIKGLLGFQSGGVVPGPIGQPRMAIVHGGEEVTPVGRRAGGGVLSGVTFEVNIGVYAGSETEKRNIARSLYQSLVRIAQAQNMTVAELEGA